jgi:hypothetical protein
VFERSPIVDQEKSMDTVPPNRQQVLALFLPVSAALLLIGTALTPKGLDQLITTRTTALKVLPIAAAHTNQLYISNLLLLFGLGALSISFAAIVTLVRARGAALSTVAALIGGFGAFCGAIGNVLPGFNLAVMVTAQVPREVAARYLVATFTSWVGEAILVGYLGCLLIGTILMAIALWQSRNVPRWLPILFAVGLVVAAVAPAGLLAVPMQLPFAGAMVILASRIQTAPALDARDLSSAAGALEPIVLEQASR